MHLFYGCGQTVQLFDGQIIGELCRYVFYGAGYRQVVQLFSASGFMGRLKWEICAVVLGHECLHEHIIYAF